MGLDELTEAALVARAQAGCFSLDQARAAGLSPGQLMRIERAGLVERVHPRVFQFVSTKPTRSTKTWAALLQAGPGAVISHEAALCAQGVSSVPFEPVAIIPPGVSHEQRGIRVHRLNDLLEEHIVEVNGLRVTTVARAVVDVSSVFSIVRLADLVDRVTITEQRTSVGGIARVYRQVNRRGRRRIAYLGEVLDARSAQSPRLRSMVERDADELINRAGLPEPIREMPIPSLDERPGLVDRAWPEARLIVEIDGRSWHARERAMATDRARDRTAGLVGWYTARVLDEEVRDQPDLVIADLAGLFKVRCELFGVTPPSGLTALGVLDVA